MTLRTKWVCPNCTELLPTRHWSVQRHIQRKHGGIGEPISINSHRTRAQMNMGSGLSDSYGSPVNSKQFSPNANNFSNLVGSRKIPFGSPAQHTPDSHIDKSITEYPKYQQYNQQKIPAERLPNEPEAIAEHNNTLASKFQEFKRLARPFFQPHLVDNVLSNLSLLAMSDKGWESLIDEIIEKLRNNTNILAEVFPQFENLKVSNVSTRITEEVPLANHHLERLSDPLPDAAYKKIDRDRPDTEAPLSPGILVGNNRRFH